ncbi:MAG: hypothetical protein ACE5D7_04170 [Fidelibacterota bacterium]
MKRFYLLCLTVIFYSMGYTLPRFRPPEDVIGRWDGQGQVIVSWCEKDSLNFSISIHSDGSVTGTIGDAQLKNGKIRRNSLILSMLKNPEYLVEGNLSGPLVSDEGTYRNSAHYLLLDVISRNRLTGGFHSSGAHIGGKNPMVFTVFGIARTRVVR